MQRFVISLFLVLAGGMAGWWLRDLSAINLPAGGKLGEPSRALAVPGSKVPQVSPVAATEPQGQETEFQARSTRPFDAAGFVELLKAGDYGLALEYFELAVQRDEANRARLKRQLDQYLAAHVEACTDGVFIDLAELWLEAYYADIKVLLLLADNQRFCGSPEEAARTLQIADTYAVDPWQQDSVNAALARLVAATDQQLSRDQDWIELLGFYEFLEIIDLTSRESQLRMAYLYALVGEKEHSRALLLRLRDNDDMTDAEWTAALDLQLANSSPPEVVQQEPSKGISLSRRGNHYLVAATINDASDLSLIIDTGASVTTLSRESFSRVQDGGFRYLGTRLFNTPNGRTQGEIYRVESMQLGEMKVRDMEVAVLDFDPSGSVDGLLGMNVLRNYRFEIDQDNAVLYLAPRS